MATATGELVVEEVADNLEEASELVRRISGRSVGLLLGGLAVGLAVGYFYGQRRMREQIKAEAFRESEEEINRIREYYARDREKPQLDEIIKEKGYAEVPDIPERPLPAPVPVLEPLPTESVEVVEAEEKDKNTGWDYEFETSQRSARAPYILHQDEYMTNESGFLQVTYTYHSGDDVLTDEDDSVIPNRTNVIGFTTLEKFGHGADDIDVVYVRNVHLELEMEICRVSGKYEVEVQGLDDGDNAEENDSS